MKKRVLAGFFLLLAGECFAAPVIQTVIPSDVLDGSKETSISYKDEQVRPSVSFATSGYTIFGVIYVAAAIAKMKSQTSTLQQSYDSYLASHSEIKSLRDTFNQELQKDLQSGGLRLTEVTEIKRNIDDDKQITYQVASADLKTKKLLVFDGLAAGYFAPSSTDAYTPRASILLSVIDQQNIAAKPAQYAPMVTNGEKLQTFSYKDFDALNQNTQQSYEGLQRCVTLLARQIADRITQAPLPVEAAAASAPQP
jgi:hypothetical protein